MNAAFRFLCLILFLTAGFLSVSVPVSAEPAVQPVLDDDYRDVLLEEIRQADDSIHLSQLYLNRDGMIDRLIDELISATRRGVELLVLLNDEGERSAPAVERLRDEGARVVTGGRDPPGTLHAKLVVFDRKRVLLGSTNWSGVSILHNVETNVLVRDQAVATFYTDWIESLMEEPNEDPERDPVRSGPVRTVVDREHTLILNNLIEEAEDRLWIGLYGFRTYFDHPRFDDGPSNRLAEGIVERYRDGLDVRLILDKSDYNRRMNEVNRKTADWLAGQGLTVRWNPPGETAHWKVLISDHRILVSSMNWAYGGLEAYAEASLLIEEPEAVERFSEYYRDRWRESLQTIE